MKFFKKKYRVVWVVVVLLGWVIVAQSCLRFRMKDSKAVLLFAQKKVPLIIGDFKVQGRVLHYLSTGADSLPDLYLIHGSPGAWNAFEGYLMDSYLRSKFRMIAIDRPGFGYSNFGDALHLNQQSALIFELIKQLSSGKKEVYLLGHSLGGPLVVQLAADYPDAFRHLVILAGSVDPAYEKPEKVRGIVRVPPFRWFMPGAFGPSNDEIWFLKKDLVELKLKVGNVKAPITWVHGDKDQFVPVENADFGKKYMPQVTNVVQIIPGANHFIPWTHFEIIRQILLQLH